MNTSTSPDQIALNQSPDILNCNYDEGGAPTKRIGYGKFNASSWGATPIRGMYEFWKIGASVPILLVAWGGKIYSVATDGTKTDLCTGAKANVADQVTSFFTMGDKAYISTGTDYCVYDGTNPVADVVGYIPTFTLGRAPTGGGTANEQLNYLSNSWKDSFSADGTAVDYTLSFTGLSATLVKAWVNGVEKTETTDFTVNRTTGVVTFGTIPPAGTNNVIIQAEKTGLMDATKIKTCTIFSVYGGKTDTRVFAAGHPTLTNYRYRSGLMDPTYWPEDAYEAVASDAEDITGFGRMIDYQIIGKSRSYHYSYIEGPDSSGNIDFPILPFNDEYGCLAGRTMAPAQGGLLALSNDNEGNPAGVAWIIPSTVRGQLNVRVISENINESRGTVTGLLDNTLGDLKAAHAIIHDNKYYLSVKDQTWVLDLKYSNLLAGVYCWYPYDTVFAKAACFLARYDGDLYLGDLYAGLIYKPKATRTPTTYADDGTAIDAYWTSPLVFAERRDWEKKFEWLRLTFTGQPDGNHKLTLITDQGNEELVLVYQEATAFDYNHIWYDAWTYGVNFYPYPQSEKVGYKSVYLQWKISNNQPSEAMAILSQSLQYQYLKVVK